MKIGALIISVNEPQLERCLESVRNQTVPFSNITHINNIIPESVAFNTGLKTVTDELVMKIDGDFILYNSAVETAMSLIPEEDPTVYVYNFRVYDAFFKGNIRGIGIMRCSVCRKVRYPNMLSDDLWFGKKMTRLGFIKKNCAPVIATHFEDADEFQIFRRLYCQGVKYGHRYTRKVLKQLYRNTGDPVYDFSLRALDFGVRKKYYPTSHNVDFDRKMFEEFNDNHHLALV